MLGTVFVGGMCLSVEVPFQRLENRVFLWTVGNMVHLGLGRVPNDSCKFLKIPH